MARPETFKGYGPDRATTSCRADRRARLRRARRQGRARRDLRLATAPSATAATSRRSSPPTASSRSPTRSIPCYVDTNVMAGRTGAADADGALRAAGLPALHRGERLHARAAHAEGRPHLPLLAEQSHRRRVTQRAALGEWVDVRARARGRDPLRRRLRGVHPRARPPALDLRDRTARARWRSSSAASRRRPASPGTRCAYTVVPKEAEGPQRRRASAVSLHALWYRRQTTKFNGVPYPIQKAAAAVYTPEGKRQVREAGRLLHGERAHHPRRPRRRRPHRLRRAQRAVHLGADAGGR